MRSAAGDSRPRAARRRAGTDSASPAPDSGAPTGSIFPSIHDQADFEILARHAQPEGPALPEFLVGDVPAVLLQFEAPVRVAAHLRGPAGARPRLHPVREPGERQAPAERLLGQAFRVAGAVLPVVAGRKTEPVVLAIDARDSLAKRGGEEQLVGVVGVPPEDPPACGFLPVADRDAGRKLEAARGERRSFGKPRARAEEYRRCEDGRK